jgi:hypothetical protein
LPIAAARPISGPMRLRLAFSVLVAVPVIAGCSGAEAVEAQQLLQQAQQAQQNLKSETFTAKLTIDAQGQSFAVKLTGGGYSKGAHAGDMFIDLSLNGSTPLPLPATSFRIVKRGTTMSMRFGDQRLTLPATQALGASGAAKANPLAGFDIARYVKDVKVEGGQTLNGKLVTKISGVLDTASLVQDVAKLGSLAQGKVPSLDGQIGDTRVVAYIDDTTHLVVAALADVTAHGDGMNARVHLDYGLTSVNKRVAIPAA